MAIRIDHTTNGLQNRNLNPSMQQQRFRDDIGIMIAAAFAGALVPSMTVCFSSFGKSYALGEMGKVACIAGSSAISAGLVALPALYLAYRFCAR